MTDLDTKAKILIAADRLFAAKGFNGTSVRDIAKEADVNIAAINYHFNSKSSLYWNVAFSSHLWLEEQIKKLANKNLNTVDLTIATYKMLTEDGRRLKNAFMMFLSDENPGVEPEILEQMKNVDHAEIGPPGGQYFANAIKVELDDQDIPLEAIVWAVKCIFTTLIHWSLMYSSGHCQEAYANHPHMKLEYIEDTLRHQVASSLEYIVKNKNLFH